MPSKGIIKLTLCYKDWKLVQWCPIFLYMLQLYTTHFLIPFRFCWQGPRKVHHSHKLILLWLCNGVLHLQCYMHLDTYLPKPYELCNTPIHIEFLVTCSQMLCKKLSWNQLKPVLNIHYSSSKIKPSVLTNSLLLGVIYVPVRSIFEVVAPFWAV